MEGSYASKFQQQDEWQRLFPGDSRSTLHGIPPALYDSVTQTVHKEIGPSTDYQPWRITNIYLPFVDKIWQYGDFKTCIFLQQELFTVPEHKNTIIEAVLDRPLPLMTDRYGNYLVQCCLKNGTREQKIKIVHVIHDNVVNLSMDRFGRHVVKAGLDVLRGNALLGVRASIAYELLQAISKSLFHPCANHVWQNLLASPMEEVITGVNRELDGKWHLHACHKEGFHTILTILKAPYLEEHKWPCIKGILKGISSCILTKYGSRCIMCIYKYGRCRNLVVSQVLQVIYTNPVQFAMNRYGTELVQYILIDSKPNTSEEVTRETGAGNFKNGFHV